MITSASRPASASMDAVDGESHRVGDGVIHVDEFHGEAACTDGVAGLVGDELDLVCQLVLFQLQLDQTVGHGGAVNGTVYLPEAIGNGTDMVFMTVGNEEAPELLLVGHQIGEVGDHQVNAVHVFLGEAYAAVNDDHVLAIFQDGAVLSDFIQTAQRDNFQFFSQFCNNSFQQTPERAHKAGNRFRKYGPESPSFRNNACKKRFLFSTQCCFKLFRHSPSRNFSMIVYHRIIKKYTLIC